MDDFEARARALAGAGRLALQLRGRDTSCRRLIRLADGLRDAGLVVIVNDRLDVVRHVDAQGLHLPAEGFPASIARAMLGPSLLLGRSAHTPDEACAAWEAGVDYVFLGPIWPTTSHHNRSPLGLSAIEAARPARVIAIGGITPDRVAECVEAGAFGVAAISALWQASDPTAVARRMLVSLDHG